MADLLYEECKMFAPDITLRLCYYDDGSMFIFDKDTSVYLGISDTPGETKTIFVRGRSIFIANPPRPPKLELRKFVDPYGDPLRFRVETTTADMSPNHSGAYAASNTAGDQVIRDRMRGIFASPAQDIISYFNPTTLAGASEAAVKETKYKLKVHTIFAIDTEMLDNSVSAFLADGDKRYLTQLSSYAKDAEGLWFVTIVYKEAYTV